MESIKRLIECFKPSECQYIRNYYLKKNNGSATKRLQLFDIIRNDLSADNKSACRMLYNRPPKSTFCQLKNRLKKDLLNFLVLFYSSHSGQNQAEKMDLECRKSLIQAKILMWRNASDEARSLLQQALRQAEKFEIMDMKIAITDLLRSKFKNSRNQYKDYTREIDQNVALQHNCFEAKTVDHELEYNPDEVRIKRTKERIRKVGSLYQSTHSPNLGYRYYSAQMLLHQRQGNLELSYLNGLRSAHLSETEPALKTNSNKVRILIRLAQMLLHWHNLKRAAPLIKESLQLSAIESKEYLSTLENAFQLQYLEREFKLCEKTVVTGLAHPQVLKNHDFRKKWLFFQSCVRYGLGDFQSSLSVLQHAEISAKEYAGLCVDSRVLEIFNLCELKTYDLLDYKVENLRKLIGYHRCLQSDANRRIVQLFRSLVHNSYDFKRTLLEGNGLWKELAHRTGRKSASLFDIYEWLSGKTEQKLHPI